MPDSVPEPRPELDPIARLTRDLRDAARTLSADEARFLVDAYYAMQRDRIRAAHQERTLHEGGEPHTVMSWLADQRLTLEKQVLRALDAYSAADPAGAWARSIVGIGPVISAGLIANIDINQAPTAGHIWGFAGLDPTSRWEKGTKRPWNGSLKRLCFLIGESFVKVSNLDNDVYGKVYRTRKEWETKQNEAGKYADQAAASLAAKKFGADTEARKHYEAGRLPPARIHLRAERYAVKLFLSHLHHVMYEIAFKKPPPKPFILSGAHPGHTRFIAPPNWPMLAVAEAQESTEPSERKPKRARAPKQQSKQPTRRRAPG